MVSKCNVCCQFRSQPTEPLIATPFPQLPWQKVGVDLFTWKGAKYLLLMDYYSRYIEVAKLPSETSSDVIEQMKSMFARNGIPQEVRSDNGPQFSSALFLKFSTEYNFIHVTSSPRYPASNGEVERAVRTVKSFLKKCNDPYLALLIYRSTPLHNGYSPAQLLMGRRLRATLPVFLKPTIPEYSEALQKETEMRAKQKTNFDSHYRTKELVLLFPGDNVHVCR